MRPVRRLKKTCSPPDALAKVLPEAVLRGIAALRLRLDSADEGLLREVPVRAGELASFEFPLPADFLGQNRTLHIGFGKLFPRYGLDLRISPSAWLVWPHVMPDSVCLFGDRRPLAGTPEAIVQLELDRIHRLLLQVLPGTTDEARDAEFNGEITNYWAQQMKLAPGQMVLTQIPPFDSVLYALSDARAKRDMPTTWLASTPGKLQEMESRLTGVQARVGAPAEAGFFLELLSFPALKIPTLVALEAWLEPHVAAAGARRFKEWLAATSGLPLRTLVLKLPDYAQTPTLVAFALRGAVISNKSLPAYGRRAGRRLPAHVPASHRATLEWNRLQVLAPAVVHSRTPAFSSMLAQAHIVLVGVGSLGSVVAQYLARSGVGHLTLVDPERFVDANLGRHVLGMDALGRFKASALRELLQKDIPGSSISASNSYIQVVPEVLKDADMVIVTTADWDSELALWEFKRAGAPWALLQAWSEPHAVAGHLLLSPAEGSADAIRLFDQTGRFLHPYSQWPNDGAVRLPACGASFIPGGAIGLAAIAAVVGKAAVQEISQPSDRPRWYGLLNDPPDTIKGNGGKYVGPCPPAEVAQWLNVRPWPPELLIEPAVALSAA